MSQGRGFRRRAFYARRFDHEMSHESRRAVADFITAADGMTPDSFTPILEGFTQRLLSADGAEQLAICAVIEEKALQVLTGDPALRTVGWVWPDENETA